MGAVIRFERAIASSLVITKLVELGYRQPGARHRATAVARAIDRLRNDICALPKTTKSGERLTTAACVVGGRTVGT